MAEGQFYEWDEAKNEANKVKHGVSFEEAVTVFADTRLLAREDRAHSSVDERRLSIIGRSETGRILTIVVTTRGPRIRVISAQERRKERRIYESKTTG